MDKENSEPIKQEAPFTIGFSKEVQQIISHFTDEYETVGFISETENPLLERYGRMQFDLLSEDNDTIISGERLILVDFQYRDSADCSKAYKSWIKNHTVSDGTMNFDEEYEAFHPDKVYLVKTDNQLIMLYGTCEGDSAAWITFKDRLFSGIKGIRNTIEFTCDSNMLEKGFCCL